MSEEISLERQKELATQYLPIEWRKALSETGKRGNKRRHAIRKRAVEMHLVDPIKAAGGRCANCAHKIRRHGSICCSLDSDFYGYQKVQGNYVCSRWKERIRKGEPHDKE